MRAPASLTGLLACVALLACGGGSAPLPDLSPSVVGDTAGLVARGEYVVRNAAVCGHCHAADPQNDPDGPLSGGFAFSDWRIGTIRAPNLTSDAATGLGGWSDAEIARAIRTGEHREGRLLAPVMPYGWLAGMSNRDALAVVRYLRTLAPVRNQVESDRSLAFKAAAFFFLGPEDAPTVVAPRAGPTAEYGDYLANHVALCGDCHTPHGGLQQKPDRNRLFAGDATPRKGFPVRPANLTPDSATGIGAWTEADFLRTLRTGVDPGGDTLGTFMPRQQILRMTDDDLRAIYRYLRTLPAIEHDVNANDE